MRLKAILIPLITLFGIVQGAWWAAAVQPVVLSLGAILGALDLEVIDLQPIQWKKLMPFINKQEAEE